MKTEKSTGATVLLTLIFGPLGLLYVSFWATLLISTFYVIIILLAIQTAFASLILMIPLWPLTIVLGVVLVGKHNRKVALEKHRIDETRHQEQLATMGRTRGFSSLD